MGHRQWYGVALAALGLLVLFQLANGSSMLQLVGVLLILAAAAGALLPHHDDEPGPDSSAETAPAPQDDPAP